MRRDVLKNHTATYHKGKPLMATEDRQRGLKDFFKCGPKSANTSNETFEPFILDPVDNIEEENSRVQGHCDSSVSFTEQIPLSLEQKIDARFDIIEKNITKLMSVCTLSSENTKTQRKKQNQNTYRHVIMSPKWSMT